MITYEQAERIMKKKFPTAKLNISDEGEKWASRPEMFTTKNWGGQEIQFPVIGIATYFIDKVDGTVTSIPRILEK